MRLCATGQRVVSEVPAANERGCYRGGPRLIARRNHPGDVSPSPATGAIRGHIIAEGKEGQEVEFHTPDTGAEARDEEVAEA